MRRTAVVSRDTRAASSATVRADTNSAEPNRLREHAQRHLGLHFTRAAQWRDAHLPILTRGAGCHVTDVDGTRYLDGLAGLFCVNLGYGRVDIATAAYEQMTTLSYATNWGAAHPPAIRAASLIAERAPGDLGVTFFVSSGSEANETAIKFALQYHRSQRQPQRTKIISRHLAYHGVSMGALSVTGLPQIRDPFLPRLAPVRHVPNTLGYTGDCGPAADLPCVTAIEQAIAEEGPDTIAAIFAEPVQNSGGALVPPDGYWSELRRICDNHGILLVADEVISGFGRFGHWFGSSRFGVVPDLITFAKGASSGYVPVGGMIAREPLVQQLFDSPDAGTFTHGTTWGGHPVATAIVAATITALQDEHVLENVQKMAPQLRSGLAELESHHRCVKQVRGTGFLYAVELMADRRTGRDLTDEESASVLHEVLPTAIRRSGVIVRGDDRSGTMIVIAPPLVADDAIVAELLHGLEAMLSDIERAVPA